MNYQQSQRYAKITSVFNAIKDNKHSKFVVHGENKKQPISIGEK
jgi:CBS domain containing-hemolysin-like protein